MKKKLISLIKFALFVVAISLIALPIYKNYIISSNSNKYQIIKVSKEDIERNKKQKASFEWEKVKSLNAASISSLASLKTSNSPLPVIGGITIPSVNLNLPIFNGVAEEAISFGAGTLKEEQSMGIGNYSLISHHVFGIANANNLLFSPLDRVENGQKIYITDKKKVYEYQVSDKFIVNPEQVEVVDDIEGRKVITLITCTDYQGTQRQIVRGDLIAEYYWDNMPEEAENGFNLEYNDYSV